MPRRRARSPARPGEAPNRRSGARSTAAILRSSGAWAPATLDGEVFSAVRRAWLRDDLYEERAAAALDDLVTFPIERVPASLLVGDAWTLRANVSAPDALSAALARRLGATLVALDRRLAAAPGLDVTVVIPGDVASSSRRDPVPDPDAPSRRDPK